jgi:hypothetical protein
MTLYVLILVWTLPNGDYTEWKTATYGKKYHCLSHLTKLDKYVIKSDWQHLKCKRIFIEKRKSQ